MLSGREWGGKTRRKWGVSSCLYTQLRCMGLAPVIGNIILADWLSGIELISSKIEVDTIARKYMG